MYHNGAGCHHHKPDLGILWPAGRSRLYWEALTERSLSLSPLSPSLSSVTSCRFPLNSGRKYMIKLSEHCAVFWLDSWTGYMPTQRSDVKHSTINDINRSNIENSFILNRLNPQLNNVRISLNHLLFLHIHKDLTDGLDLRKVLRSFCFASERREE